jgi:hypothetical protein
MVWLLLPGVAERAGAMRSVRGSVIAVVHPARHCLALALEALSGLLPGAPLTDEQHELRSSHHRPGSELAAVSARRCQRLIAGETSSGLSA